MRGLGLAAAAWPGCIEEDVILRGQGKYALFTDLGLIGKHAGCFNGHCETSDKFRAESAAECAFACAAVGECNFWSFGSESGESKCWLRIGDGGREDLAQAVSGSRACVPPTWPDCIEGDTILRGVDSRGERHAAFVDVSEHGKASGCFGGECTSTDKFNAVDAEECATVCKAVSECHWWAFGDEEGAKKCWLRLSDRGREPRAGAVAGSQHCAPLEAYAPAPPSSSTFQGVWSLAYTNGHRDTYVIDAKGRVKRPGGQQAGVLVPQGSDADAQRDPKYQGKFFLPSTHRAGVWEYAWMSQDGEKLHLRHFCVDGHCSQTSPEGSPNFCCSATGTRSSEGPRDISEL